MIIFVNSLEPTFVNSLVRWPHSGPGNDWAGDGVHLTSPAYRVAARLLMAELEKADHGEVGEPVLKRARLESVVPAPAPTPIKQAAQQLSPSPKPATPPLLLSGQLPPATGMSNRDQVRGGYNRWVRGAGGRGDGHGRH
jgi:hypothetical protein